MLERLQEARFEVKGLQIGVPPGLQMGRDKRLDAIERKQLEDQPPETLALLVRFFLSGRRVEPDRRQRAVVAHRLDALEPAALHEISPDFSGGCVGVGKHRRTSSSSPQRGPAPRAWAAVLTDLASTR